MSAEREHRSRGTPGLRGAQFENRWSNNNIVVRPRRLRGGRWLWRARKKSRRDRTVSFRRRRTTQPVDHEGDRVRPISPPSPPASVRDGSRRNVLLRARRVPRARYTVVALAGKIGTPRAARDPCRRHVVASTGRSRPSRIDNSVLFFSLHHNDRGENK